MRRLVALALLLPMLAACSDDPTATVNASHVGTYQLQTVDGEELPVQIDEEGGFLTISGGAATLNANGTFSIAIAMSFTEGEETTSESFTLTGDWSSSGNTVNFDHADGGEEGFQTATISGDVLTTLGGGDEVIVFKK